MRVRYFQVVAFVRWSQRQVRLYSNIERESLALVFGTSKFRQYLLGRSFTLETDHHPLVKLLGMREGVPCLVSTRLKKWKLNLAAYDYTIRYIPGKRNVMADFMSRNPISGPASQAETIDDAQVLFIEEELIDAQTIIAETKKDPVLSKVLQFTVNGWAEKVDDSLLQPFFSKRWELSVSNDVLLWNDRVVIPTSLRLPLLLELHAEHSGSVRMKRVARRYFWWPKMDDEMEETTQHCANCRLAERYVGHFKDKIRTMDPKDDLEVRIQRFLTTAQHRLLIKNYQQKCPRIDNLG